MLLRKSLVFRWLCFIVIFIIRASCDVSINEFSKQIDFLLNDILGADDFQYGLDSLTYTTGSLTHQQLLENVRDSLEAKLQERVAAVRLLRDNIVASYDNYPEDPVYSSCCSCCSNSDQYGVKLFQTAVDFDILCHAGPADSGKYPTATLLELMKTNFDNNPTLKWQYFASEDGLMTYFPGNDACDSNYDPRFRPWYSQTVAPVAKDIVLLIDRSGSMDSSYHKGRQLMEIAKDAAITVLDTLNPNDRVAVVFFSDTAVSAPGCYSNELAEATDENKNMLRGFIQGQTGSGGTRYSFAFQKAFEYFGQSSSSSSSSSLDSQNRTKVIVFLTDGKPTETDSSEYLDIISNSNRALGNEVVILTFGFGNGIDDAGKEILEEISNQTYSDYNAGEIRPGRFLFVNNPDNLRQSMARYYDFFAPEEYSDRVTVAVPYVDSLGLGYVTSICLPVRTQSTLRGVTCIDMTLSDLFADATYFSQHDGSYAFLADQSGRLFVHPLLPRPNDVYEQPVYLHILDLETASADMSEVVTSMMSGVKGSKTFSSRRVLSRGDSTNEGVDTVIVESQYLWDFIAIGGLQLCLVIAGNDQFRTVNPGHLNVDFGYHRLDLYQPNSRCRYINRVAVTDSSVVKLAPSAFKSMENYLAYDETSTTVEQLDTWMLTGTGDSLVKEGIREAVMVSSMLNDVMLKDATSWQYSIWRFVALKEGIFRIFPGTKVVKEFDPTQRAWYKRAVSQPDVVTFSKPYLDASGAGIIITMAKAIYEGKASRSHQSGDPIAGVIGMDFTLDLFNSILSKYITECEKETCIAMDTAGYIISHPDYVQSSGDEFTYIDNVHITQKEPSVAFNLVQANILRKDGCINFNGLQLQSFWRTISSTSATIDNFDLVYVPETNIYVIVKRSGESEFDNQCSCATSYGPAIPQCNQNAFSGCECPCFTRDGVDYRSCEGTFVFDVETGSKPPCTPSLPIVSLESVAGEEQDAILELDYCYDVESICPTREDSVNCSATSGCRWCHKCEVRTTDSCGSASINVVGAIVGTVVGVLVAVIVSVGAYMAVKAERKKKEGTNQQSHTNNGFEMRAEASAPPMNIAHDRRENANNSHEKPPPSYDSVAYVID